MIIDSAIFFSAVWFLGLRPFENVRCAFYCCYIHDEPAAIHQSYTLFYGVSGKQPILLFKFEDRLSKTAISKSSLTKWRATQQHERGSDGKLWFSNVAHGKKWKYGPHFFLTELLKQSLVWKKNKHAPVKESKGMCLKSLGCSWLSMKLRRYFVQPRDDLNTVRRSDFLTSDYFELSLFVSQGDSSYRRGRILLGWKCGRRLNP